MFSLFWEIRLFFANGRFSIPTVFFETRRALLPIMKNLSGGYSSNHRIIEKYIRCDYQKSDILYGRGGGGGWLAK